MYYIICITHDRSLALLREGGGGGRVCAFFVMCVYVCVCVCMCVHVCACVCMCVHVRAQRHKRHTITCSADALVLL